MSDIAERLRAEALGASGHANIDPLVMEAAADEIKRLTAENESLRRVMDLAAKGCFSIEDEAAQAVGAYLTGRLNEAL